MPPSRHFSLDALRGFAVMGILLTNIVAFALPGSAYINPLAAGNQGAADVVAWATAFILVEGKMRGLFSLLFGASMLLIIEKVEADGRLSSTIHGRRMLFLFGFGMLHYWFIWAGDILALYALCGLVAFFFRNMPPHKLARIGAACILGNMMLWALVLLLAHDLRQEAQTGSAATRASFRALADALGDPNGLSISADVQLHLGSYWSITAHRLADHVSAPLQNLYAYGLETLGLMAWGMAFLKSGALTGHWPRQRLQNWAIRAYAIGFPLSAALALICLAQGFETLLTADIYFLWNTPARMIMLIGHLMLLLLLITYGEKSAFMIRAAAAGRMAFSNYILTSILMTCVFYGYGLRLFNTLSRAEIYLFTPIVWTLMLIWSPIWLRHFRYGPLEWLWRSLVYRRWQPLLISRG